MHITSNSDSLYPSNINKTNNNKEIINPFKGQDYILDTLDEEGNQLLNDILVGKTDQKKWMIKLGLDMELSTEVEDGTLANRTNIDNSKENTMNLLEGFIQRRQELNTPDMIGVGEAAERLLEAYQANNSVMNIANKEDSAVDKFLEDLYLTDSISTASTLVKQDIQNKVDEYAKTLIDKQEDTQKSEMINEYKQELLQEYKVVLESISDEIPSLKQQGIIKASLDENTKEIGLLESLLTYEV